MKTKFIVNPIAGTGKQNNIEKSILKYIDKNIFDFDIEYTVKSNHATEISKKAVKEKDLKEFLLLVDDSVTVKNLIEKINYDISFDKIFSKDWITTVLNEEISCVVNYRNDNFMIGNGHIWYGFNEELGVLKMTQVRFFFEESFL